jgi:hypothetical protein
MWRKINATAFIPPNYRPASCWLMDQEYQHGGALDRWQWRRGAIRRPSRTVLAHTRSRGQADDQVSSLTILTSRLLLSLQSYSLLHWLFQVDSNCNHPSVFGRVFSFSCTVRASDTRSRHWPDDVCHGQVTSQHRTRWRRPPGRRAGSEQKRRRPLAPCWPGLRAATRDLSDYHQDQAEFQTRVSCALLVSG